MADLKISQLTGATTPLAGTEVLPIVQSGTTKQVSVANLTSGRDVQANSIGAGTAPVASAWVKTAAGTSGIAPILLTAGTNQTTAVAGSVEYDGKVGYFTPTAVSSGTAMRGLMPTPFFYYLTASNVTTTYTTPNTVNILASSGVTGQITLPATATTTTYYFECFFALSGMSTTSGSFSFGLGGTATYTSVYYGAIGNKNTNATQAFAGTSASLTVVSPSNTTATGFAMIRGIFTIGTGGGTVIPQITASQSTSNLTVATGAYFSMTPIGSGNTFIGPWT